MQQKETLFSPSSASTCISSIAKSCTCSWLLHNRSLHTKPPAVGWSPVNWPTSVASRTTAAHLCLLPPVILFRVVLSSVKSGAICPATGRDTVCPASSRHTVVQGPVQMFVVDELSRSSAILRSPSSIGPCARRKTHHD